jgi:hypothetical protein
MDLSTSPNDTPTTYLFVSSESGGCPTCGRIDHRYVDGPTQEITRTCDYHRTVWRIPSGDVELEALKSVAPEGYEVRRDGDHFTFVVPFPVPGDRSRPEPGRPRAVAGVWPSALRQLLSRLPGLQIHGRCRSPDRLVKPSMDLVGNLTEPTLPQLIAGHQQHLASLERHLESTDLPAEAAVCRNLRTSARLIEKSVAMALRAEYKAAEALRDLAYARLDRLAATLLELA